MILHIPHSSTYIPETYIKEYNSELLLKGIGELTDFFTNELFYHWNSTPLVFKYSRFFCDVERFSKNEPMDNIGQGIFYTKYDNATLRTKNAISNDIVLDLYRKHHINLVKTINEAKTLFNEVVIVDCHSFPNKKGHPDFCIGYNSDISSDAKELVDSINEFLSTKYKVEENYPYKGALIPEKFNDDNNINSIMIEVNKKLYLCEDNHTKNNKFNDVQDDINKVLDIISEYEIRKDDEKDELNI